MIAQSLNGTWRLRKAGAKTSVPAAVPGDVHGALLRAHRIRDPFRRDNERAAQWIGETDWIYARTFDVPDALLAGPRVYLRFGGIDTLACIRLNGADIGRTANMFRTYEFEVRPVLRRKGNSLEVTIAAPCAHAREKNAERTLPQWGAGITVPGGSWMRKEQCNFGWDWGPMLVTGGIWRDVSLAGIREGRIESIALRQEHASDAVLVHCRVQCEICCADPLTIAAYATIDGATVASAAAPVEGAGAVCVLHIKNPRLWWPRGMGEQPLYFLAVELRDSAGVVIDSAPRRIGLRTLRLERAADQWGESFRFAANGVPFFAKGANWIPVDAVLSRRTPDVYRRLVADAVDAHMNMLRVWGGGIYEDDLFYDLCDANGICVWQDFMFACAAYPAFDAAFVDNVREEARQQIARLHHHPCLALFCGNNELEQGLVGLEWTDTTMSWHDYHAVFDEMLPGLVAELSPDVSYVPSSPHTPAGDRARPNDPVSGDAHLWDVWWGRQPFEWYRTAQHRFVSEFGFQSFPEPRTVEAFTEPRDRNITCFVMEHHQRSSIGNAAIISYMLDWFRMPVSFDMTLWLSQILQAVGIQYGVEHWRRNRPRTMGTLYWQLNDCWPGASWASIDYFGRYKALQYAARRFYAPLLVSGVEDAQRGCIDVHVTSDCPDARPVVLRWTITRVNGREIGRGRLNADTAGGASASVHTIDCSGHINRHGARDVMVWLELREGKSLVSTNLALFAKPKHLELEAPRIAARVRSGGDGAWEITLSARRPALWTWIAIDGNDCALSDNFLHLRPGAPVAVVARPRRRLSLAGVRKALRVYSLIDTYRTESSGSMRGAGRSRSPVRRRAKGGRR